MNSLSILLLAAVLTANPGATSTSGRGPGHAAAKHKPAAGIEDPELVVDRLAALARSIEQRGEELSRLRSALRHGPEAERDAIGDQIETRERELRNLKERFRGIASGVDLAEFRAEGEAEVGWSSELQELLSPLVDEIKQLTSRPRQMHRLEREIESLRDRLATTDRAVSHLNALQTPETEEPLRRLLAEVDRAWQSDAEQLRADLTLAEQELGRLRGEETSVYGTVESLSRLFFRHRGRNLLLALTAFAGAWLILRLLLSGVRRLSPYHRHARSTTVRVFDLACSLATVFAATLAGLLVLYAAGDWVLLSVASLFLLGIAWASKTAAPRGWRQATLLLNLGGVREGERILYDGVPYRVESLSFETYLSNPELAGGKLRLPLRALDGLRSRPFTEDEPWFPTRRGDWVLLEDGKHARVALQTPEIVTVVEQGGARRHFRTEDFFRRPPTVLSAGFRLSLSFGVDYRHQALVTTEIPAELGRRIAHALDAHGYGDQLLHLDVEFKEAAASSLDFAIQIDLAGSAAPDYQRLGRLVQQTCVDTCNENGWVIPFPQLTVHTAAPDAPRAS